MKKIILSVGGCLLGALALAELAMAGSIVIYNYEGKASLRRDNTVYQADYDMACKNKDILRSDKDGFIDLTSIDYVGIRLLGATECLVIRSETNNKVLQLNYGTLHINLAPMGQSDSFEIETPIATVSASGAQFTAKPKNYLFLVMHQKNAAGVPSTTVVAKQGDLTVNVKESHTGVTVLEGRMIKIEEGAFAPTARTASEEELLPLQKAGNIYITTD